MDFIFWFKDASPRRVAPGVLVFFVWTLSIAVGAGALSLYEFKGSAPVAAVVHWPDSGTMTLAPSLPTLVFFMHPRCPCTAASIAQLDSVLSEHAGAFRAYAVVTVPPGVRPGWERGRNLDAAQRVPGATLIVDHGGELTRRFGAQDSGTLLVFSPEGAQRFSGGITVSRGHEGESMGSLVLHDLAAGHAPRQVSSPVFGCPLLGPAEEEAP